MCDCARRELATPNEQYQSQAQPANNSHRMYQTLLAVNMLDAENPHCLRQGALNDQQDEEEGGLIHANRLPLRHNALAFTLPDQQQPPAPQCFHRVPARS